MTTQAAEAVLVGEAVEVILVEEVNERLVVAVGTLPEVIRGNIEVALIPTAAAPMVKDVEALLVTEEDLAPMVNDAEVHTVTEAHRAPTVIEAEPAPTAKAVVGLILDVAVTPSVVGDVAVAAEAALVRVMMADHLDAVPQIAPAEVWRSSTKAVMAKVEATQPNGRVGQAIDDGHNTARFAILGSGVWPFFPLVLTYLFLLSCTMFR